MKPYWTVDKLFEFLNLGPTPQFIDKFIAERTGEKRSNNTTNEKYQASFCDWFDDKLDKNWLKSVEQTCAEPMRTLGYANYSSDINENGNCLAKTAYEVWPYNIDLKNNQ